MNHRDRDEDTPTNAPMTQEQMGRTLRKIERALLGNPYDQLKEPGLATLLLAMHKDYYGDKENGVLGTKKMVLQLWEWKVKIVGICGGISVLAWAIEMFIQYHAK